MLKSNIIAGSNIYIFSEERPEYDNIYVKHVQDIEKLKHINELGRYDTQVAHLSDLQKERTQTIDRCVYAKNDPCWGYALTEDGIISACINGDCRRIMDCNPSYSEAYAKEWQVDKQEYLKYGQPKEVKIRYSIDLESDDEMNRYNFTPRYNGLIYASVETNQQSDKRRKIRTDPITGRIQQVIGYDWTYVGGDYGSEVPEEIWGFIDNEIIEENHSIVKAPLIEPLIPSTQLTGKSKPLHIDIDNKKEVIKNITEELKNSDAISLLDNTWNTVIICDNFAERGFISKMLTDYGVQHGYQESDDIQIVCKDATIAIDNNPTIILTANVLNGDNSDSPIWASLLTVDEVFSLKSTNREFRQVEVFDRTIDVCANNYGLTHICLDLEDFQNLEINSDGIYELNLNYVSNNYTVSYNGTVIGYSSERLLETVNQLHAIDETAGIPVTIEGIQLCRKKRNTYILGIGHMLFTEY